MLLSTQSHDPYYLGGVCPFVVNQPASPSIWPAVQSLRRGLPTNPGVQCGAYVGAVEEMMCVVYVSVTKGAHKPLQIIKAITATGWGKQKETLMATYKVVIRPTLYGRLLHPRPALTN